MVVAARLGAAGADGVGLLRRAVAPGVGLCEHPVHAILAGGRPLAICRPDRALGRVGRRGGGNLEDPALEPAAGPALRPGVIGNTGVLTCRQSQMYANVAQLYEETIRRNPGCWLAHHNLGVVLAESGSTDEAIAHYEAAIKLKPDYAKAHVHLGGLLADRGRLGEAIGHYRRAIEIKSDYADAYNNLGTALGRGGRFDEAIGYFRQAVAIAPDDAEAQFNLGAALACVRQTDEATRHFQTALVLATQQHKTALAAQLTALLRHGADGPRRLP